MKAIFPYLLFGNLLFTTHRAAAQYYFYNNQYYSGNILLEAGISGGIMNSLTDLGGRKGAGRAFIKDLNLKVTHPCYSFYATATYKDAIGLRLELTSGQISSSDGLLQKTDPRPGGRYGRNLSFQTAIKELQSSIEIHPLFLKIYEENQAPFWSPYIISGIGYYTFNPRASLNGRLYDLHPLKLEGQGFAEYPDHKPYALHQFNIPVGIGLRYEINALLQARLEIIHRLLFTDYLDDVSTTYIDASLFPMYLSPGMAAVATALYSRMQELQPSYRITEGMKRGNASDNDAYFSMQLKIGWLFRSRR